MQSIGAVSRIENVLLGAVLAFLITVSVWFVALKYTANWPLNAVLAAAILGLVGARFLQIAGATARI
jgi:hypothetical protein